MEAAILNKRRELLGLFTQNKELQKKETKERKPRRARKTFVYDEDDEEKTKKEVLEKRHLETYEGLYRLRNSLSLKYFNLLRKKVQKQHSEMQKCNQVPIKQQNMGYLKKGIPVLRIPYCKLSSDDQYLENISKSKNYLIINLENELAKAGILKSKRDHEHFHQLIHPSMDNLKEALQDIKSKVTSTKSFASFHIRKPSIALETRTKGQTIKSSLPMTGQHPNKDKKINKETNEILPKLLLTELQKRPEVEHEKASQTFCRNVSPSDSHIYKEHVHQMYSLSLSNMAYTRRLLEKSGLFADFEDENNIHDLLKNMCQDEIKHVAVIEKRVKISKSSDGQHKKILKCKKNGGSSKASSLDKTEVKHNNYSFDHSLEHKEKAPLSMEEARANYPSLEAKTVKFWTNYINS
ncbi:hypothetical protein XENTR_v10013828 [Xenopus tropicalis]|nr:hypothetical protein XENTR_v10013828 [Xenopus tropicalis]